MERSNKKYQFFGIFSLPLTLILTDKKIFRQILSNNPNILPPNKTYFFDKIKAGKKIKVKLLIIQNKKKFKK